MGTSLDRIDSLSNAYVEALTSIMTVFGCSGGN